MSNNVPNICIQQGRLIDPYHAVDAPTDLYLSQGKVVGLGQAPDGFRADITLDAQGMIVCPGFIDLSVALREPGLTQKGNIASETRAAAGTGITTLCCPPDTLPVCDSPAVATLILDKAELAGYARVLPVGALTQGLLGEQLSSMYALKEAGCVGLSNARRPVKNYQILRRCFEYAASHDMTVFICAQDADLYADGVMHEGATSTSLGLPGIPETSETVAVAASLLLVEQTGVRAHFSQITTARAADLIRYAQLNSIPVSADVALQHLHFTDDMIAEFDSYLHAYPPLRTERDQKGLLDALQEGVISSLCSHHKPHEEAAKMAPFPAAAPGMSGLDAFLPMALRLVRDKQLALSDLIYKLTRGPAEVLGVDAGHLGIGADADVCVFDPESEWLLTPDTMLSAGKNSPLVGQQLRGRVQYCLCEGQLVYSLNQTD